MKRGNLNVKTKSLHARHIFSIKRLIKRREMGDPNVIKNTRSSGIKHISIEAANAILMLSFLLRDQFSTPIIA